MSYDILVVGCGLTGAVIAQELARVHNKRILIIDKRNHIGGNCYDYVDETTGIRVNKYGAHLFHTNDEGVWTYINQFSKWIRYDHKVVANVDGRNVPVPVNMETINVLCGANLKTKEDVAGWLDTHQVKCENPSNSEEVALSMVGEELFNKIFLPYTIKQWNKHPRELDSSVLSRIPIQHDNDSRYFSDKYQAIPEKGYTGFFESLLNHPNITVQLNTSFEDIAVHSETVVFTGPIDSYFKNSGLEKLEYRSLRFEEHVILNTQFAQQNMVINTPSLDEPTTRTIEYKHLPYPENSKTTHTIVVKEYPSDTGEPYYPVPNRRNQDLYDKYKKLADKMDSKVHMIGRLANYKYFNMDQAIRNALNHIDEIIERV
jgi:UDP-galactopyranose mutase